MKANQKGFSIIEIVIVIVVIGLIGAVGWLAYDRQKDKSDEKTTTTQEQKPDASKKDEAKQPTFFEVKELGVKFELTDDLTGLYYSMGNNNRTAYFSLNEFKGTECAADKIAQVALTRYTETELNDDHTAAKEAARKIGDYYYLSSGGQSACSDDAKVQEKASQLRSDITKLLPGALVTL